MIRVINEFQYYKKTFKAGDLTLSDYLLYLKEPEETLKKILLEFNKELPKMNDIHMKNFLKILFSIDKNGKTKKEDEKKDIDSMHILICIVARNLKQPISELLNLPYKTFIKIQNDMDIILNPEKLEDKIEAGKVDKKGLNELKNIIS